MRVHHLAFRTRDVARLEEFYAGLLGLQRARRDEERGTVWLRAGETLVMIEPASDSEPPIATTTKELVAFAIDEADAEKWKRALTTRGITIEAETGFTMYFRDPDGRRVALSFY